MILKIIKNISKKIQVILIKRKYKGLNTKEIFEKIYNSNQWGKNSRKMNSGPGSHNPSLVNPYIDFLKKFFAKQKNLSVLDLGCGDFNIGSKIFHLTNAYTGIDIVHSLIELNKKKFKDEKLNFYCFNFIEKEIPKADCVIIRQVLQHLDNKSISIILKKIMNFKYVIITEHIPKGEFISNIDKPIGPTIRLDISNSGIEIEKPPFNFSFNKKKEINIYDPVLGGKHKTIIYSIY